MTWEPCGLGTYSLRHYGWEPLRTSLAQTKASKRMFAQASRKQIFVQASRKQIFVHDIVIIVIMPRSGCSLKPRANRSSHKPRANQNWQLFPCNIRTMGSTLLTMLRYKPDAYHRASLPGSAAFRLRSNVCSAAPRRTQCRTFAS